MNKQTMAREMIQRLGLGGGESLKVDQQPSDHIDSEIMPSSISADCGETMMRSDLNRPCWRRASSSAAKRSWAG